MGGFGREEGEAEEEKKQQVAGIEDSITPTAALAGAVPSFAILPQQAES